MKVLILNGSPRANGNTAVAIKEMENVFASEGVELYCTRKRKIRFTSRRR